MRLQKKARLRKRQTQKIMSVFPDCSNDNLTMQSCGVIKPNENKWKLK